MNETLVMNIIFGSAAAIMVGGALWGIFIGPLLSLRNEASRIGSYIKERWKTFDNHKSSEIKELNEDSLIPNKICIASPLILQGGSK